MNLSTARSEARAKEIGVRKAIGSKRSQLINQFFTESIMVAFLALILSLLSVQLIIPYFNDVASKQISIPWLNPIFWFFIVGFTLLTGILAGSYPALYLSSFKSITAIKGKSNRTAIIPRKILVVVQFTISITLIIGTITVFQQIQFVKNKPLGYNQNNLITVPIKSAEILKHYQALQNDLMKTGSISSLAQSDNQITQTFITNSGFKWQGKNSDMQDEFVTLHISHDFGSTVGWKILEGRDFSENFGSDSTGIVINKTAANYMDLENPIGQQVEWGNNGTYTIIGVVNDMVTQSPYSPVKQTVFFVKNLNFTRPNFINIRVKDNIQIGQALKEIESAFKKYDPANPFEYFFTDQEYAKNFENEERIGKLSGSFTVLTIFISCLGLFGMASFVAQQRIKEISIRKVLGASSTSLWQLLSKDFVVLVLFSCLMAGPIAYYFLENWLEQYDYRTSMPYWIFGVAGLSTLVITLLTVSYHIIKASILNPIKSLQSD